MAYEVSRNIATRAIRDELIRGGVGSVAVKIASTALGFVVAVVLARALGADKYGVYAFALAVVSLIGMPVQFGLSNLVVRDTTRALERADWPLIGGLWRWANSVAVVSVVAIALLVSIVAWLLAPQFTVAQVSTLFAGLCLLPLSIFANLHGAALRGLGRAVGGQVPESLVRPGFFALLLIGVVILFPQREISAVLAMWLHVGAASLSLIAARALLNRGFSHRLSYVTKRSYNRRAWPAAVVSLAFLASMQTINQYTDLLMLGLFRGAEDVGTYRVVVQGGTLVVFGLQAMNMIVAPLFARHYGSGDLLGLRTVAKIGARISLSFALPVFLSFVFWGEDILRSVFGGDFASGHVALVIIACGQVVNAGVGSVGVLLNMSGHERDTARGVSIAAVCNVILNLILIPPFGMNGAAAATAVTIIVWNSLLLHYARRRFDPGRSKDMIS